MRTGTQRLLRLGGICMGGFLYLISGVPSCAGHAGYFRERLMRRAECMGTTLDFVACAVAVMILWLVIRPTGTAGYMLLVLMAAVLLWIPAFAALVNCGVVR